MDEKLNSAVIALVQENFERNADYIAARLTQGISSTARSNPEIVRLVRNATQFSIEMSTQLMLRVLEDAGIVEVCGDGAPTLTLIKGGLSDREDLHE